MEFIIYLLAYIGIGFGVFGLVLGTLEGEPPMAFFGGIALMGGLITLVTM